ncbi:MAG: hypothetical protein ACE144_02385 [Thermodesulfobacteriota bacterium]
MKLPGHSRRFPERYYRSYCAPAPAYKAGLAGHVRVKDVKSIGPVSVATFMGITDKDEYDRTTRDAYELLQFIVQGMKTK